MISVAPSGTDLTEWDSWRTPLSQYAETTGLTVSAYDGACVRQIGPLLASPSSGLLNRSALWREDGAGVALEQRLALAVLAGAANAGELFHGMRVCAMPLLRLGQVYGVLVFGWCFAEFSSPMQCEHIARLAGTSPAALWDEVRLEAPVSAVRMATYTALLATLAGAIDRQRDTIEELGRVSRTRDLFLATVSHEMRTPLAALSMRIELLLKTVHNLPAPVESALLSMRMHVRQEAGMIDDLIDAARTLTGQMSVATRSGPLGPVVRDAIATIEGQAREKNIALSVSPSDYGDSIEVAADPRRLQQVLWNLIMNAVKFTPPGGQVQVRIDAGQHHVDIHVVDNGQGIAEPDLAHVFGAFTLQTQANATGLGLGLYIARRIVELHGGTLTAASAGRDKGSTFTVRLPLAALA